MHHRPAHCCTAGPIERRYPTASVDAQPGTAWQKQGEVLPGLADIRQLHHHLRLKGRRLLTRFCLEKLDVRVYNDLLGRSADLEHTVDRCKADLEVETFTKRTEKTVPHKRDLVGARQDRARVVYAILVHHIVP